MSDYHLAQVNVARAKGDKEASFMRDFFDNIERINALAESQDGFVWRLKGEVADAEAAVVFNDPKLLVTMSVWRSLEALADFTYHSNHRDIMRRRKEWFDPQEAYMALWWVPKGHIPTPQEAKSKIALMAKEGPTPAAFGFKTAFPAPDQTDTIPILAKCEKA
jgi:heme-degrading monooxygenase HmoA